MKKILLILLLLNIFLKANIIENNIYLIKQETYKQDALAESIDIYIQLYGTAPTSISEIKSAELLSDDFIFNGSFTVDTVEHDFTIASTISNAEPYQKDFYLNNYDRNRAVSPSISGNSFSSKYYFSKGSISSFVVSAYATVSPTSPSSPTNGDIWHNSSISQTYFYTNAKWNNLRVKSLYIVRSTAELPVLSNENDGGIVHTGTTLSKYLYVSGAWHLIPQNIPFDYDGIF